MKKLLLTLTVTLGMTLTASTIMPTTLDGNKKANKSTEKKVWITDTTTVTVAYPCPCSKLECGSCGGDLYWTAKAYKKYTGRKCQFCNGKSCETCEWEGVEFYWQAGCKCNNCGNGFKQPECN